LPAVSILAPYLLWKLSYYGQLLPNSYYAKGGGSSYFSRGFLYLWLCLKPYFSSWLFFLALPLVLVRKQRPKGFTFVFLGVLSYILLFVARVGGDFMYARFVVPMIPFAMLAFEMAILQLWPRRRLLPVLTVAVLACSIVLVEIPRRNTMLEGTKENVPGGNPNAPRIKSHKGIIDERYFRTVVDPINKDKERGELLEPYFRDLDVTVLLRGRCCLGYYGKFKTCIEHHGLTDNYIAHLPVEHRGRVGHEKQAPLKYMEDIEADFILWNKWPFADEVWYVREFRIRLPDATVRGFFITYDRSLVKTLSTRFGRSFEYVDFENFLDWVIETQLPEADYQLVLSEHERFRDYYFSHNDDKAREAIFLRRLSELEKTQTID
jgi:hypothetical protein